MFKKCMCCGFYTIDSDDEVISSICDVCFWQYDIVAQQHPEKSIGPNKISLNEAKNNYRRYGACKKEYVDRKLVREPKNDEFPMLFE